MNEEEIKEFEELWYDHDGTHFYKDEWKAFINSLLSSHKDRLRKEVEGLREETVKYPMFNGGGVSTEYNKGFDQALDEVLELLKK